MRVGEGNPNAPRWRSYVHGKTRYPAGSKVLQTGVIVAFKVYSSYIYVDIWIPVLGMYVLFGVSGP